MKSLLSSLLITVILVFSLVSCDYIKDDPDSNNEDSKSTEQKAESQSAPESNTSTNKSSSTTNKKPSSITNNNNSNNNNSTSGDNSLPESTPGLNFKLNSDGKGYTLIKTESCSAADIVIGTYNGLPVTDIDVGALASLKNIKTVTIADCVKTIGNVVFDSCSNLTTVIIGDGVTSIGDGAFRMCYSLKNVTIGKGVRTIGYDAFWECDLSKASAA